MHTIMLANEYLDYVCIYRYTYTVLPVSVDSYRSYLFLDALDRIMYR